MTEAEEQRVVTPRVQGRAFQKFVLVFAAFLFLYPATYFGLTRIYLALDQQATDPHPAVYFPPMTVEFGTFSRHPWLKEVHRFAAYFFHPAWWVDRHCFGGPDYYVGFPDHPSEVTKDQVWHE
ncbi:MAG: hypothetical protein WC058_13085 [Phycisphaeraceae bacterium]